MEQFDKVDIRIINELKKNCKRSEREISRVTRLSAATTYRRIKKLEKSGIIKSYGARIDEAKLGNKTVAFVLIRAKAGVDYNLLVDELLNIDGVEDVATVTGQYDTLLKVRVRDTDELNQFLLKCRKIEDIAQTETLIALGFSTKY